MENDDIAVLVSSSDGRKGHCTLISQGMLSLAPTPERCESDVHLDRRRLSKALPPPHPPHTSYRLKYMGVSFPCHKPLGSLAVLPKLVRQGQVLTGSPYSWYS